MLNEGYSVRQIPVINMITKIIVVMTLLFFFIVSPPKSVQSACVAEWEKPECHLADDVFLGHTARRSRPAVH